MARTKVDSPGGATGTRKWERKQAKKLSKANANGSTKAMQTPTELYAAAVELVSKSEPEAALVKAKQLWTQVEHRGATEALPALNLLGELSVELGDTDSAREYFEHAVALDPEGKVPETSGGGAEKFLWLAQLSEEGGRQSVLWYEKGVQALQNELSTLSNGQSHGLDEESLLIMRFEKSRKLATALCGMVEVYMTDLSWEDDAEERCEHLITEAMSVGDEPGAEVLQTLASVRLSQDRQQDAQAALTRSIDIWRDLEPEDADVPDFPTRISLSRLLMEAGMLKEAMKVLSRLVEEDDQSVEAWYLGGWCQCLLIDRLRTSNSQSESEEGSDTSETIDATRKASRHWLRTSMKLYELQDYEDDRLFDHAKELVTGLDKVLGPEDKHAEGGDEEYADEWDGFEDNVDVDEEMQDV